jgi:hypothetical protein
MEKETCRTCGSNSYITARFWVEKTLVNDSWVQNNRMTCDRCSVMNNGWRDAEGNKIIYVPADGIWHTLGVPINSARELSEHAKKHNLAQVGVARGKSGT